jgi:hypothetical protein
MADSFVTFGRRFGRFCFGSAAPALSLCALVSGCSDGERPATGPRQDPLDTSAGDPYRCTETTRALGASEETAFGYPADSVRARILGVHTAALSWQESAASYGPEQGSSELAIEVLSEPSLEWVERSLVARAGWVIPTGVTEETYGCLDRVQMRAEVRVSTAGGALDERTEARFEAGPSGIVLGWVELPLAALVGSFEGTLPVPESASQPDQAALLLHFAITEEAVAGDLAFSNGELHGTDGSVANTTPEPIAHFPSGMGCGPEHGSSDDQLLRRAAMADVLARLNALSPITATHAGGGETLLEASFQNRDDSVCRYTAASVEATLQFPGRVELASADGSVEGAIEVDVVSLPEGRVLASASGSAEDPEQMVALSESFGIQQAVSMAGYRAGTVEFQSGLEQGAAWGALRAYGLGATDCPDAGAAPADAAPPVDECGSERAQLWGMSWGTPPGDL